MEFWTAVMIVGWGMLGGGIVGGVIAGWRVEAVTRRVAELERWQAVPLPPPMGERSEVGGVQDVPMGLLQDMSREPLPWEQVIRPPAVQQRGWWRQRGEEEREEGDGQRRV